MQSAAGPIRPTDDEARATARGILAAARIAALATPASGRAGFPGISRIAFLHDGRAGLTLISGLSAHARALREDPRCALLLGEPPAKGDPLAGARLSLRATACPVPADQARAEGLDSLWLRSHPKAKLYLGFADFFFVRFACLGASLNGGFGKAYELAEADLLSDP